MSPCLDLLQSLLQKCHVYLIFQFFHLYFIKCFELLIPRVEVLRKYGIKVIINNFQAHA